MPVTALDPTTALIVVDLQAGLAGLPTIHPFDEVVGNAATLAAAFRAQGLPVVLVNVAGGRPAARNKPWAATSSPTAGPTCCPS
jgi:nicotinamidase-related amidase